MTTTDLVHVPAEPAEFLPVTPADMAWMAGVLDTKGAVVRKKNKMRATPQVVLYMRIKDERIVFRLSALTGTAPEMRPSRTAEQFLRRGCAEHCKVPHVHVGDGAYPWRMPVITQWALTGIAAAVVLANLAPYMSTYEDYAGDVAEIVGNFAATGQGSGAVRRTLLRLKLLGWQIPAAVTVKLGAAV